MFSLIVVSSSNGAAGQKYVNLLNTAEYAVSELSGDSAKLNFRGMTVMGNSFLIFIHENNAGPQTTLVRCTLLRLLLFGTLQDGPPTC